MQGLRSALRPTVRVVKPLAKAARRAVSSNSSNNGSSTKKESATLPLVAANIVLGTILLVIGKPVDGPQVF